jgi:hypothetical protein
LDSNEDTWAGDALDWPPCVNDGRACLLGSVTRTTLRELLDHAVEIGIARAKAPCNPVPTALGNSLAINENLKLTRIPRLNDSFNIEALLYEGHETRDLGLIVLSCRAMNDLDLHLFLQSASCS